MAHHRIIIGDSTSMDEVEDNSIDLVITDPPYGIEFRSHHSKTERGKAVAHPITADWVKAFYVLKDVCRELEKKVKDPCDLYFFTRWDVYPRTLEVVSRYFTPKNLLVWDKEDCGMGDLEANWGFGHELIIYCKVGRRPLKRRMPNIIRFKKVPPNTLVHPTEKPLGLFELLIKQSSNEGDTVLDPFLGSGTTTKACFRLGRNSIGYEKNPYYLPIIKEKVGYYQKTLTPDEHTFEIIERGETNGIKPTSMQKM